MTDVPPLNLVKVVKFTGDRKSGVTEDGVTVYRQDRFWMGQEYGFVAAAQYGSHFIYRDPHVNPTTLEYPRKRRFVGRMDPMCSCGAPAVIVGSKVYAKDASPTTKEDSTTAGQMLVCWMSAQFGHHVDGSHD